MYQAVTGVGAAAATADDTRPARAASAQATDASRASPGELRGRLLRSRVSLALRPLGRLAHQLAQLGKHRGHGRAVTLERLDSLQPGQHRSRLLHASKVGRN